MQTPNVLHRMLRKIESRTELSDGERAALLGLPYTIQALERSTYLVREGERPVRCCLILSGLGFRQKVSVEGTRQIVSVSIPGDFVDLEGALLNVADHNVQALTRCQVAFIRRSHLRDLIGSHAGIALALWADTLIDGSIFREWVLNVGRRDARSRIAHLLCEFARRLESVGLAEEFRYELPMTQEQLGDATGLTSVHVNRVLKGLEQDKLIRRSKRVIAIPEWEALRRVAGFSETYLHLDQVAKERERSELISSA